MGKQKEKPKAKTAKRTNKSKADHRTLNQGQGPDFQTQDDEGLKNNEAISEEDNTEQERELPSKEREEIPYVGDNPDEIRKESPKLDE
jgi:hypothetical protein